MWNFPSYGLNGAAPEAYATAMETWDPSTPANYAEAVCGSTRCLTHSARPGIKLTSSWILVGFLTCWTTTRTPFNTFLSIQCRINHSHCVTQQISRTDSSSITETFYLLSRNSSFHLSSYFNLTSTLLRHQKAFYQRNLSLLINKWSNQASILKFFIFKYA